MSRLESFDKDINVAVFGASGGLGAAFIEALHDKENVKHIFGFSRSKSGIDLERYSETSVDITDEDSVQKAAEAVENDLHLIIIATGMLHNEDQDIEPEKNIRQITADNLHALFDVNTVGPSLVMKHFLPLMPREERSVCAAVSARVGSISDNGIGGWYAYRTSKAALNMMIKTFAIEVGRRYKKAAIIGLHPGTVDTRLSEPFQANVPDKKLFSPAQAAGYLIDVLDKTDTQSTGLIFDWQGEEVKP